MENMSAKPAKPPPTKPRPQTVKQFRAMYDYEAEQIEDSDYTVLSFEEGDIITYISKIDDHWVQARVKGQTGIVPVEFLDERASQVYPLHEACRRGNLTQVKLSLKEKVPVNQRDKTNSTPIYWASSSGYLDCIEELLSTGFCNLKLTNNLDETALHAAASKGFSDVCKVLVEKDSSIVGLKSKHGKTALDLAHDGACIAFLQSVSGNFGREIEVDESEEESEDDG